MGIRSLAMTTIGGGIFFPPVPPGGRVPTGDPSGGGIGDTIGDIFCRIFPQFCGGSPGIPTTPFDSAPRFPPAPTGTAGVGMAAVSAAVIAAGGAIVGSVIRITRSAWASISPLIKQAALALGLTIAFTDIDLASPFGGACPTPGGLSNRERCRLEKFNAMTSAGVGAGVAARASGIGRKPRRGLSFFELRGFRKVSSMLGSHGMVPRKIGSKGGRAKKRARC